MKKRCDRSSSIQCSNMCHVSRSISSIWKQTKKLTTHSRCSNFHIFRKSRSILMICMSGSMWLTFYSLNAAVRLTTAQLGSKSFELTQACSTLIISTLCRTNSQTCPHTTSLFCSSRVSRQSQTISIGLSHDRGGEILTCCELDFLSQQSALLHFEVQ